MNALVDALLAATRLKDVDRAGWVRRGLSPGAGCAESVAAHSWGVAWLAAALCPADLDRARVLTYAVLHDLPEAVVGDITPHDGVSRADKSAREAAAWDALSGALPPAVGSAWPAYDAQDDAEARFVHELDRLDMAVQAVAYALDGRLDTPEEFLASARRAIHTPSLMDVLDALAARLAAVPTR